MSHLASLERLISAQTLLSGPAWGYDDISRLICRLNSPGYRGHPKLCRVYYILETIRVALGPAAAVTSEELDVRNGSTTPSLAGSSAMLPSASVCASLRGAIGVLSSCWTDSRLALSALAIQILAPAMPVVLAPA